MELFAGRFKSSTKKNQNPPKTKKNSCSYSQYCFGIFDFFGRILGIVGGFWGHILRIFGEILDGLSCSFEDFIGGFLEDF